MQKIGIARSIAAIACTSLVIASCSSDKKAATTNTAAITPTGAAEASTTNSTNATTTAPVAPAAFVRPPCNIKRDIAPQAVVSPDGASEIDVTSFDGTVIRAHWFPNAAATAAKPLPVVLKGPGWSGTGDTNLKDHGSGLFVDVNNLDLHDAGYSVLTWDPRGFGKSTGNAMVDDTNFRRQRCSSTR